MRIALLANLKQNAPVWEGMSADQWDDLDTPHSVNGIMEALQAGGHEVVFMEASILPPHNLVQRLAEYAPDLCFNIAESHFGDGREAQIPAVLEMLRIPYTGSQVLALALTLDKPMTKRILMYHGLPTPEFQVFEHPDEPLDADLVNADGDLLFPMFIKPSREGTSMGISPRSIVRTVPALRARVAAMLEQYNQPVLCEHFIEGREVMIGMVGNLRPTTPRRVKERTVFDTVPAGLTLFPPLEVDLQAYADTEAGLYTNRIKTEFAESFQYMCPASLDPALAERLDLLAATVFCVTDCQDMARVDFRLDQHNDNKPYILEINPLPGLSPGISDLCLQANAVGWRYEQLINTIVEVAATRQGIS
jgi:D-alanine-D-alanine ligase